MDFRSLVEQTHDIRDSKVLCPAHSEDTPSCHIYRDHAYCFGCGKRFDAIEWVRATTGAGFKAAANRVADMGLAKASERRKQNKHEAEKADQQAVRTAGHLWADSIPISRTLGEQYFRDRGIGCDLPPTLRFHPNYPYGKDRKLPCVVARADDTRGELVGIQAIPIDRRQDKKSRGRPSKGACYLGNRAHPVLVVAESVASALAGWLILDIPGCPVATLGTGAMSRYQPPDTADRLVIVADHDEAGKKAALNLKRAASIPTAIKLPRVQKSDAADWIEAMMRHNVRRTAPDGWKCDTCGKQHPDYDQAAGCCPQWVPEAGASPAGSV